MQGNQNPRNVPPAMPVEWQQGSIGFKHGLQSSEVWVAGEQDSRQICDQRLAKNLWRVSVIGSEFIRLNVVYGTSRAVELKNIQTPFAFFAPGQLAIYAFPVRDADVGFVGGFAYCTCTPVSSAGLSNARTTVGAGAVFPPNAARFVALDASTVQLGGGGLSIVLALGQSLALVPGSSLTAGDGYLEFDP